MARSSRQDVWLGLKSSESYMPLLSARRVAIYFCLGLFLAIPAVVFAQANYVTNGTEYSIIGSLPGDQMFPDVALNTNGGFVVWQDNVTDGSDWGISAMQLNSTLSGSGNAFRVNINGPNAQEHPRMALLKNGGAAFVWQGGVDGVNTHIYARFLWPITNSSGVTSYVWLNPTATSDIMVNSSTNGLQSFPAIATLTNGSLIVVWSSYNQASSTSMMDIYGQMVSTNGKAIGGNFLINQFTTYNQRNPSVAALRNGGFVVTWVSEQERSVAVPTSTDVRPSDLTLPSVDIYARQYTISGTTAVASGNEFLVDAGSNPCSSPKIAAASDSSYMITWCAKDQSNSTNGWDIFERSFTNGIGGAVGRVNSYTYGDQYNPRISSIGGDYLIVFTSLGQDGSREGVYGQYIREGDLPIGNEFLVNTTTLGQQMQPTVASDGVGQFLTVWTGFTYTASEFDLFAQRYANTGSILEPMAAPFVWAPFVLSSGVYQPQLAVSWPPVQGLSIAGYKVFVDGASTAVVTTNQWIMTAANGLSTNSTHSFALEYVTSGGTASPMSLSASGTTWSGSNWGGVPYEWMEQYYGNNQALWPSAAAPANTGSPTLYQIFMSGGSPTNSSTWLRTSLTKTQQGMFLNWNTQPGMTYQVQVTTNFTGWNNYGAPRFEAGTNDSIYLGGSTGYYRVQILR